MVIDYWLHASPVGTDIGTGLIFGLMCAMGMGGAQMITIRYRADQTRRYLRRQGLQADAEPLPPNEAGLPRRSDFWVLLVIALAACAILLFAVTHSAQH